MSTQQPSWVFGRGVGFVVMAGHIKAPVASISNAREARVLFMGETSRAEAYPRCAHMGNIYLQDSFRYAKSVSNCPGLCCSLK